MGRDAEDGLARLFTRMFDDRLAKMSDVERVSFYLGQLEELWGDLVARYGAVHAHSKEDGFVCIHLGELTKGCTQLGLAGALLHAAHHLEADAAIDDHGPFCREAYIDESHVDDPVPFDGLDP